MGGAIGPVITGLVMNRNPLRIPITTAIPNSQDSGSSGVDIITTVLTVPSDTGFRNTFILLVALIGCTFAVTWLIDGHFTLCKKKQAEPAKVDEKASTVPDEVVVSTKKPPAEAIIVDGGQ